MKFIFDGLVLVLDSMASLFTPRSYVDLNKIIEESEKRSQWYHEGEWWDHPVYHNGITPKKQSPFDPFDRATLKEVEAQGRHRFTLDIVKLGDLVNRHQNHVEINDAGRLAIRNLYEGQEVIVSLLHKMQAQLDGEIGTIVSIDYHQQHPPLIYPVPYEHTTMGWIEKHGENWNKAVKRDKPCISVKFPGRPGTYCFYGLDDLIAITAE